jgi:F1F0 ATPase subunit 2
MDCVKILGFLLAGALTGWLFFGGLWLTVRALPRLAHPHAAYWAGTLVRYGICLALFMAIAGQSPAGLAAACAGFYVSRMVLVPRLGLVRPQSAGGGIPCR